MPSMYFYVVVSANENGNNRFTSPGSLGRPEFLDPVCACDVVFSVCPDDDTDGFAACDPCCDSWSRY